MTNGKYNRYKKLIGQQGLANVITPLFGGIPATGAIARTATNFKNGAASILVLVIFSAVCLGIPLASMAPILMFVTWNMESEHPLAVVNHFWTII